MRLLYVWWGLVPPFRGLINRSSTYPVDPEIGRGRYIFEKIENFRSFQKNLGINQIAVFWKKTEINYFGEIGKIRKLQGRTELFVNFQDNFRKSKFRNFQYDGSVLEWSS